MLSSFTLGVRTCDTEEIPTSGRLLGDTGTTAPVPSSIHGSALFVNLGGRSYLPRYHPYSKGLHKTQEVSYT